MTFSFKLIAGIRKRCHTPHYNERRGKLALQLRVLLLSRVAIKAKTILTIPIAGLSITRYNHAYIPIAEK